jgi:putative ABC transport system substrate-binding protein
MTLRRRDFITLLGGAAVAWPLAARAQQTGLQVVGFVSAGSTDEVVSAPFRKGLTEAGYVEGQNVAVEYHWLGGRYEGAPALMADLVRRRIAVIAIAGSTPAALAAKTATTAIPIVFSIANDPVRLGLVQSLARPAGNVTGVNFLSVELMAKRLGILHELLPKAVRIAVLVNPANGTQTEFTIAEISEAARSIGLQPWVLRASTSAEIDKAFAELARDRADALFIAPDAFFASRPAQFAVTAARYEIPAVSFNRQFVEAGALMSYGADIQEANRLVGVYVGRILKGARPSDLPVVQPTKFELAINVHTAQLLGLEVPPSLLALADDLVE